MDEDHQKKVFSGDETAGTCHCTWILFQQIINSENRLTRIFFHKLVLIKLILRGLVQ